MFACVLVSYLFYFWLCLCVGGFIWWFFFNFYFFFICLFLVCVCVLWCLFCLIFVYFFLYVFFVVLSGFLKKIVSLYFVCFCRGGVYSLNYFHHRYYR